MKYDKRNREALAKLAPNTQRAALAWYEYCEAIGAELLITETIRDLATQKANVAKGASQTLRSYHLVGQALDFVPVTGTATDYNAYARADIVKAIAEAKRLGFKWGGEWKTLVDKPHLEYPYTGYGLDKKLNPAFVPVLNPILTTKKEEDEDMAKLESAQAQFKPFAQTIIDSYLSPAWNKHNDAYKAALAKGDKAEADKQLNLRNWQNQLANAARVAAGMEKQ
ncbi:M15 family metallopeptidase [Paenibacillus sp. FSL R5-0908]|uniref:M15 family metallopeptidase n=1 Tax=Paenibacillus sp. FSL R5-0908 TaxID=2921664 RepID=UPI0030F94499